MSELIKQRIAAVRRGEIPEGYRKERRIGLGPKDWKVGTLSDVLHCEQRSVPKPTEPYWRLGVRSWAKGTFHSFVDDPTTVDMEELFEVKENDLVVNITFAWEHAIAVASKEDEGLLVSHRFPTYVFDHGNVPAYFKAVVSQKHFKDMLDTISPGGAGRNRVLDRKDFLRLPCYIPPVSEQLKIAEILLSCDRVIETEQKLIEELQRMKKTCLAKMFPREGTTVPELRFPGFTAPWEQRKLGDVLQTLPFKAYLKSPEQDGRYEIIQQGSDPIIGYANGEPCKDYKNTVIFGDHTISLYKPKNPFFVATDGVRIVKGFENMDGNYLLSLLERNKPQSEGYKRYYSILADIDVFFTGNHEEQSKIGEYFSELDNLITLHQRELEEEQRKKKALMQLLLTGLVRVNA